MGFTIFYDGSCPLCEKEMSQLKKLNIKNKLHFVDIMDEHFESNYPHLDHAALNERIHGMCDDGTMLIGLDATHRAWSEVGRGWVYAPLRWPIIRYFADKAYLVFARNRYKISYWITGRQRCQDNNCRVK